jgi:iron complex outermembrane receptor protein
MISQQYATQQYMTFWVAAWITLCSTYLSNAHTRQQTDSTLKKDSAAIGTNVSKKVASVAEITVTAMRQKELALEVPLAVSVVPVELFHQTRGFGLDEALSLVPGVLVQSRTGNQDVRVTIRGFGARGAGERSNAGTSRGIRVYVDGIPETEPDGRTAFDLIDLTGASSIEVLRSNASALWGNAAGGVINISTVPTGDRPFISAQAQFGSFGFQKQSIRAMTTSDAGKLYISLNNTAFNGWREQSRSLLSQFNAGWIAGLSDKTRIGTFLAGASNNFQIPGPLTPAQFEANPQQAQGDSRLYSPTYIERRERRFNRLGRIGSTVEHTINDNHSLSATVFLGSKYLQRSERNTFRDFTRFHVGGNALYRSNVRLSEDGTTSGKLLVGVDQQYQDGAILFYNLVNGERGTSLRENKREGASNVGVFAQGEITLGEYVSIVAGARYDNITYFNDSFINPSLNEQRAFERVTPKLGISYRPASGLAVYANLGGGVEVPAGNEMDTPELRPSRVFGEDTTLRAINPLLKPIQSTTVEVGAKQIVEFDSDGSISAVLQRLTLDAAAYWIDITNDIVPYRGGRFYLTAGRSQRIGGEIGVSARFASGVDIWATATLMQSRFVDYRLDSGLVARSAEGRFADFSGNKQPGIPDIVATLRARWTPPFAPMFFAEGEVRHIGTYYADDVNSLLVPTATVIDAVVGVQEQFGEHVRLFAFARLNNVLNAKYVASIWINPDRNFNQPLNNQAAYIEPGLPQGFVGSLGIEWRF